MCKYKEITEDAIKNLVDAFYDKVRGDKSLAPIFNQHVKDWSSHLPRMYDFWSSIMLKTGKYKGNPVAKHQNIMPFEKDLFDQWLLLFSETTHELFEKDIAEQFDIKSRDISRSLQYMLYEYKFH